MLRLSFVTCALLVNIWVAQSAYAQAPVIDLSNGGSVSSPSGKPTTLEGRISRLERLLENQTLVDMTLRLESIQQEMQRMFGELEVISHEVNSLKRRQRELYLDVDRRFQKLESDGMTDSASQDNSGQSSSGIGQSGTMTSDPRFAQGSISGGVDGSAAQMDDEQIHKTAYQTAFNLLREGKYDLAKKQFGGFIQKYPQSDYADNAQYWLGEVNYVQRNFDAALIEFNKVLTGYPDSSKFADALLKIGLSEYEMEHWELARNAFKKIIEKYPNSSEAQLAEKRLQKINLQTP